METVPTIITRERKQEDLAALIELLTAVYAQDGYPVEGVSPPSFCESFLCPPNILYACVALVPSIPGEGKKLAGHALLTPTGPGHAATAVWKDLCERSNKAEEGKRVVSLGRLFVSPAARGQGIGRVLVKECERWAATKGLRLVLDVMSKDTAAIAMYERLGWQRIGASLYDNKKGQTFPSVLYVNAENSPAGA